MEMISLLKGPAAVLLLITLGYLMVKWITWIQYLQDREINRLNRENKESNDL